MKRSGMTLIELVVTLAIVAILALLVTNMFIGVSQFNQQEQSRILVGDAASRIFTRIDTAVRQGKTILTNATVDGTTYTTGPTTMVFSAPSIITGSPSPTLVDTIIFHYSAATKQMEQITEADPSSSRPSGTAIVLTNVSDAYFRYTTDDPTQSTAVTMVIIASGTVGTRTFSQPAVLYETLRNHT